MWTSVPQIDERRTRIKTSNSPTVGIGISSNQSPGPRSRFTSACIDLIVSGSLLRILNIVGPGFFASVSEGSSLCLHDEPMGQRLEPSLTLANLPRSPPTSHLSPLTPIPTSSLPFYEQVC